MFSFSYSSLLSLFICCLFPSFSQFIMDPCASSPCLHGNCSRSDGGEDGESAYMCECTEGYEGEKCDQILLDLPPADWDPATPSAPEPATPAASTTTAATQPQPLTTVTTTTTTPAPPTLQSWQPKPGQRLLVVSWEADRVRTSPGNPNSGEFILQMSEELMLCDAVWVSGDGGSALCEPWAVWADIRNAHSVRGGAWRDCCEVRTPSEPSSSSSDGGKINYNRSALLLCLVSHSVLFQFFQTVHWVHLGNDWLTFPHGLKNQTKTLQWFAVSQQVCSNLITGRFTKEHSEYYSKSYF